jgi:hypothetical protein
MPHRSTIVMEVRGRSTLNAPGCLAAAQSMLSRGRATVRGEARPLAGLFRGHDEIGTRRLQAPVSGQGEGPGERRMSRPRRVRNSEWAERRTAVSGVCMVVS